MSGEIDITDPVTVAVGAIGEPGRRVFYLQARDAAGLTTFKVEKQQVAALAEYLRGRLSDLPQADDLEEAALEDPPSVLWPVGPIGIGYDADTDRLVIELTERLSEDSSDEPEVVRLHVTRAQAAALSATGAALVAAGRPPCPLCGAPLDPEGHKCPRKNGHRPPRP